MTGNSMQRQLVAILAADVAGYSRLMGEDEAATLKALQACRRELIEPKAAQYGGRIVKLMGDGILMAFASVVDAVQFAVEMQVALAGRGESGAGQPALIFRVGINLGDVIIEDDDIYGDGVNVAARIEGLAEPGGITLARSARDQVRDKLDLSLTDLGEIEVKNIARPIRVYRVEMDERAAAMATPVVLAETPPGPARKPLIVAAVAVVFACIVGLGLWQPWVETVEPASMAQMALPLPDKPSIAVLPFDNISDDSEQEYFADGMTEDLITDLSKLPDIFVIARNSTFTYKGRPVKVQEVAEDLGVRYVVEGSVRRHGDDVRINAQLIDALSGHHLWADRYDGTLGDVFALQDAVVAQIVEALEVNLLTAGGEPAAPETAIAEAYDLFLRGWAYYQRHTPEDFAAAIPYFEQSLALDPNYSRAHAALAATYWQAAVENEATGQQGVWVGWLAAKLGVNYNDVRRKSDEHLRAALSDPSPLALQVHAGQLARQGRHADSIAEAEQAIALDPNDPVGHEALAKALIYAGKPEQALPAIEQAMRLDPNASTSYAVWLGIAQFNLSEFEAAAVTFKDVLRQRPDDDTALIMLTAALGQLDRPAEAAATYTELNAVRERWQQSLTENVEGFEAGVDYQLIGPYTLADVDFWPYQGDAERSLLRKGLELAGVPAQTDDAMSPVTVPGARTVDAAAAKELFEAGVTFVDVRGEELHRNGRIPGSQLLDLATDFNQASLQALVDKEQEVVIYCEGPRCLRSSQACAKAVDWGFENVFYFREGLPSWRAAGFPVESG